MTLTLDVLLEHQLNLKASPEVQKIERTLEQENGMCRVFGGLFVTQSCIKHRGVLSRLENPNFCLEKINLLPGFITRISWLSFLFHFIVISNSFWVKGQVVSNSVVDIRIGSKLLYFFASFRYMESYNMLYVHHEVSWKLVAYSQWLAPNLWSWPLNCQYLLQRCMTHQLLQLKPNLLITLLDYFIISICWTLILD